MHNANLVFVLLFGTASHGHCLFVIYIRLSPIAYTYISMVIDILYSVYGPSIYRMPKSALQYAFSAVSLSLLTIQFNEIWYHFGVESWKWEQWKLFATKRKRSTKIVQVHKHFCNIMWINENNDPYFNHCPGCSFFSFFFFSSSKLCVLNTQYTLPRPFKISSYYFFEILLKGQCLSHTFAIYFPVYSSFLLDSIIL